MRTTRSLTVSHSIRSGGLPIPDADHPPPLDADPSWMKTSPQDADPPGCRTSLWTEGMTHTCENITLTQTSFAGGIQIN